MRLGSILFLFPAILVACVEAVTVDPPADTDAGTSSSGGFANTDASAPEVSLPDANQPRIGVCATSECPSGRATCPNNPFPCAVDLSSDDDNCGACGRHCPSLPAIHATTTCVEGDCRLWCAPSRGNCNGYVEDGCEVDITRDSKNCGGCGTVCPANHVCTDGKCECAVLGSCGACGHLCPPPPEPAFPPSWHAGYTCASATCNQPRCNPTWDDCNNDFPPTSGSLEGDGCEHSVLSDPLNCGMCGKACAPGEICRAGVCTCVCDNVCFPINTDINNCGACGVRCPGDRRSLEMAIPGADPDPAHGRPVCSDGLCDYRCTGNWADCDGNMWNGCETSLMNDPLNCGGCGIRCEGVEGQACIDGLCATKACEVQ